MPKLTTHALLPPSSMRAASDDRKTDDAERGDEYMVEDDSQERMRDEGAEAPGECADEDA